MIDREYLGMVLHTSLRKFCDSYATSIAYNAIEHLDEKIWTVYLDILWEELYKMKSTSEEDVGIISVRFDDYFKYSEYETEWKFLKDNPVQQSLYYILICSFKLFDGEDWANYAYYVFNDE